MRKVFFILLFIPHFFIGQISPIGNPTPQMYGAVGDGVSNDCTAVAKWLLAIAGKTGDVPGGTYLCSNLIIPANTVINSYGAWFKKNRSGDFFMLNSRVEINGMKVNGNAASGLTGRGFVITSGNDQKLTNVEILYNDSFNLAIAKDVGLRFSWIGGQTIRYGSLTNPSIKLGEGAVSQESNGDRFFSGLFAGGTWLIDVSYSQTTIIQGCNFVNMKFRSTASKTLVNGCRIATLGNELDVDGTQCNVSNNIIAGGITILNGATYNTIRSNTLTEGETVTNNSGNATNTYP